MSYSFGALQHAYAKRLQLDCTKPRTPQSLDLDCWLCVGKTCTKGCLRNLSHVSTTFYQLFEIFFKDFYLELFPEDFEVPFPGGDPLVTLFYEENWSQAMSTRFQYFEWKKSLTKKQDWATVWQLPTHKRSVIPGLYYVWRIPSIADYLWCWEFAEKQFHRIEKNITYFEWEKEPLPKLTQNPTFFAMAMSFLKYAAYRDEFLILHWTSRDHPSDIPELHGEDEADKNDLDFNFSLYLFLPHLFFTHESTPDFSTIVPNSSVGWFVITPFDLSWGIRIKHDPDCQKDPNPSISLWGDECVAFFREKLHLVIPSTPDIDVEGPATISIPMLGTNVFLKKKYYQQEFLEDQLDEEDLFRQYQQHPILKHPKQTKVEYQKNNLPKGFIRRSRGF